MPDPDSRSHPPENGEATRLSPSPAAPATVLQPGAVLGNTYVIEALLGRGGMGEVYRATHAELGTEHAIKIMLPSLADDPKIVQLFREEARKLGRVNNDAIVNYEGFFRDEHGLRYLVTEFVHGESLAQILRRRRLEPDEVLRLRDRLASGLAAAHEMDIVHRDVSPENILLPEGRVDRAKLIDFGIAKAMGPANATVLGGEFAGKYSYVSPEQVGLFGGEVDLRSDIYSLGLVLATAAIGFGKKLDMGSSPATMIAARQLAPDLSEVPAPLRRFIAPMLAPRPDDRPPSMRALPGAAGDHLRASVTGSATVPVRSAKRRAFLALAAVAGAIVLIVAALALVRMLAPPPSIDRLRASLAAATAGYQCASLDYTLGPDRSARISGYAATPADIDRLRHAVDGIGGLAKVDFAVGLRAWPYCEAQAILRPLVQRLPRVAASVSLAPPGGGAGGAARLGQPLYVDVRAPSFDGFIYIDYFDSEGDVLHLLPNSEDRLNFRPAQNHLVLGKPPLARCWILGGRTGEQLITLVATAEPLFPNRRPEVENARDYLEALSQAIAMLPAGHSTAATDFFPLEAASPVAPRTTGCRS